MVVVATLSRGSTTIELPLLDEGAGAPLIGTDIGKPEAGPQSRSGALDPRWSDNWSQLETYTLAVRFTDRDAYDVSLDLADLIKSHAGDDDLVLDIPLPEFDSNMIVAPAPEQDTAVSFAYDPGQTDWVDVEISLARVEQTLGSGSRSAQTPRATGDGPITLSDGTTTIEFVNGVTVERSVGRPNSVVRRSTGLRPNYITHDKVAFDEFELSAEFLGVGGPSTSNLLMDMVGQPLGRSALTLDFNGLYGIGAMDVVPRGSNALRTVRPSGERHTIVVPSISLRRVRT